MRRGQFGLRTRSAVAFALVAALLATGLSLLAHGLTRSELLRSREQNALAQGYLNARVLRFQFAGPEPDITGTLAGLEGNADTVTLANVSGDWYSGSVGVGPDALPRSLLTVVNEGGAGHQRIEVDDEPYLAFGVAIPAAETRYFELVPLADIEVALERLARGLVGAAALASVAGAGVGWYASGRVLRPLRRMAVAASGIADGTLDLRLDAVGDPHLEPLERSFNRMADTIQERIDREARFTSDVSHELRSPVAAMLSSIEIARRRLHDPDASLEALDHLQERVDGFHHLVLDLLEISRADAGVAALHLELVDASELADAVLRQRHDGTVPVDCTGDGPFVVRADKRRLGQMVTNLVENADNYAGGPIRIEVAREGDRVVIAVEDAGPGVAPHEREHIFERFARGEAAREAGRGTGLGLSLVREHARIHGGALRLEDRCPHGSRFVIDLPAEEDPV